MKKKTLVFGGSGLVGSKFIELYHKDFEINAPDASLVDILNKNQVLKAVEQFSPDAVLNFAAFTDVEAAESQKGNKEGICFLINAVGAKTVAEVCGEFGKKLIHISTEYVFDGTKSENPYTEKDKPSPVNWYGQTKYFGEQFVLESGCFATIVRICMPFSPFYALKKDIARFFLDQLRAGNEITAVEDQKITPTLVIDISFALAELVKAEAQGIYHVCSTSGTTPFEFAKLIARQFSLDVNLVKPVSFDAYNKNKEGKLLKNSWLDSIKFVTEFGDGILHTIEESVGLFKTLSGQTVDGNSLN